MVTQVGEREWARPLPPGLSDDDLDRALDAFAAAVGAEAVLTSEEDLRDVPRPVRVSDLGRLHRLGGGDADRGRAGAGDRPDRQPLQGAALAALDRAATTATAGPRRGVKGSVIVSLRNMNRVLEINEESAYAVVEPGVRWFDLYDAIQAGGHKLMLSVPDLGWGSVIGNTLDHGLTYLPYGDRRRHAVRHGGRPPRRRPAPHGDGRDVRQPRVERLQARPRPDARPAVHAVELRDRHEDGRLADAVSRGLHAALAARVEGRRPRPRSSTRCAGCSLDGTIRMVPQIINTLLLGSVFSSRDRWHTGEGPIPDEGLDRMARELEIGRWMMRFALHGDEAVVDHRFEKIKEAFERIPGAEVWGTKCAPADIPKLENPIERVQGGVPSLAMNAHDRVVRRRGGRAHRLLAGRAADGRDAHALRDLLRGMIEAAGLDYMAALIMPNARSFIHITLIIFDTKNEQQTRAAYDVSKRLVPRGGEARLRRVPGAPRLHGPRDGAVRLQRPRVAALRRADQGRARPERHPRARASRGSGRRRCGRRAASGPAATT